MAAKRTVTLFHESRVGGGAVASSQPDLTLNDIVAVATRVSATTVELAASARRRLDERREDVIAAVTSDPDRPVYGFNRGFGSNVRQAVDLESLAALQRNLIVSHCAGVGPYAPRDVVRATMLLRARSLARGHSVVRSKLVELIIELLNKDIVPAVPRLGSVSASGDLAPLSHIAAVLIGEGEILVDGDSAGRDAVSTREYRETWAAANAKPMFEPVVLEMKEGLALNNGCQYSTAWAALAAHRMRTMIESASLATAITAQVMFGADTPFCEELHGLRPHAGSQVVAGWIFELMKDSPIRAFHAGFDIDGDVQDPYNLRCAPQVLGTCYDLIERAVTTIEIEANSVTDNPIDLYDQLGEAPASCLDALVSGGHFHGMPIAVDAFGLTQAASIMARLSNMRAVRYVDPARNKGLHAQIRWPGLMPGGHSPQDAARLSTESGMILAEYTSAGVTNWIWGLAMPSHLFSMSTDSGQEDHVSMAANVAMHAYEASERLAEVLAVEFAYAVQALAVRRESKFLRTAALDDSLGQNPAAEVITEGGRRRTQTFEKSWWLEMSDDDLKLAELTQRVADAITENIFKPVRNDRELSPDLRALAKSVLDGALTAEAASVFERRH